MSEPGHHAMPSPVPEPGAVEPTIISIVGMHRSGTSLVARLVNLLGVSLGPDEAISPQTPYNAKGLWEHGPLVDLSDELLATFGGRWDAPPTLPEGWLDDPRLVPIAARARRIAADHFRGQPMWGWKDPRACLTLPFWQRAFGPARHVVCLRNPGAVLASLARRDAMAPAQAEGLWLAYVQAVLTHTNGQPRLFMFYEDVVEDRVTALRRLARFVGCPERADDPRIRAAADDFVDAELCHHHVTVPDLLRDPHVSSITQGLFLALRSLTTRTGDDGDSSPDDRDGETMTRLAERAAEEWTAHAAAAATAAAQAERAHHAAQECARLGAEVERITRERVTVGREADAAHATLHEIQSSHAWALVTAIRAIIVVLLPDGSRRRAAFHAILRRLAPRRPPSPPA